MATNPDAYALVYGRPFGSNNSSNPLSLMRVGESSGVLTTISRMQATEPDSFALPSPPPPDTLEPAPENEAAWLLSKVQADGAILGGNAYYVGPDRSGPVDTILMEAQSEAGPSGTAARQDRDHARRAARAAVLRERGNAAARAGALGAAIAHYDESLALAPNDPSVLRNRAHVHLQCGDWAAAEADCTHALQFEPGAPRALYRRAVARLRRGSLRQARADAAAALDADPGNSQAGAPSPPPPCPQMPRYLARLPVMYP